MSYLEIDARNERAYEYMHSMRVKLTYLYMVGVNWNNSLVYTDTKSCPVQKAERGLCCLYALEGLFVLLQLNLFG